jgi:excisionase family DNA binding protein
MKKVVQIGNGAEENSVALVSNGTDAVLTVDEVAGELRCSKAHVYNAINGKVSGISPLRIISMGRRVLIRRSAFEFWKQENERMREKEPCDQ